MSTFLIQEESLLLGFLDRIKPDAGHLLVSLIVGVRAVNEITTRDTSLRLVDRLGFGSHYARTLAAWDAAFLAARAEVAALGFDETFVRMWHFYLEYSRAGFASGYLDDHQLTFARAAEAGA